MTLMSMMPSDPIPWLLASDEPAARWVTLTELLEAPVDDQEVVAAHAAVLRSASTRELLDRIPDWEVAQPLSGHDSPAFAPNLVALLGDMGVGPTDDPRLERLGDQFERFADDEGRFTSHVKPTRGGEEGWSALQCDAFGIAEALVRLGRGDDAVVRRALSCIQTDAGDTAQGYAWRCRPDPISGFRGPGRKADFCPMLVVQALRLHARLPAERRPPRLLESARVLLRAWRVRGEEKPYVFGHGRQFKTVKWPPTWYSASAVLDAVGRYPELWRGDEAMPEDRRAVVELAACLVAYNVSSDGSVTPRSARRGFEEHSFGQKKLPSPWATARLCAVLHRLEDLADEIAAVDVLALGSSKGGTGTPVPPRV